ncbi:MAG: very short patch repair endonuclease [Chloroflexota bacterium]|nr:very short patch repair endonuclease [Chloroflexota bacterium]
MTDTVSPEKRSQVMALVGSKNTKPELLIRKRLHALGFRYRLHVKDLPGKPDLVFPRYKSVIQINGCFWHGHSCPRCRMPSSNTEYWNRKVARNMERDAANRRLLLNEGWRVLTIWECALTGKWKLGLSEVIALASKWLLSKESICEIKGEIGMVQNVARD